MTPTPESQALRVAVAVADGWTKELNPGSGDIDLDPFWEWVGPHNQHVLECYLPNYPECRDAIVSAVLRRFRTRDGMEKFILALAIKIFGTRALNWKVEDNIQAFALATATAEQLCRAYVAAAGISVEGGG